MIEATRLDPPTHSGRTLVALHIGTHESVVGLMAATRSGLNAFRTSEGAMIGRADLIAAAEYIDGLGPSLTLIQRRALWAGARDARTLKTVRSLEGRGLAKHDPDANTVALTGLGQYVAEAVAFIGKARWRAPWFMRLAAEEWPEDAEAVTTEPRPIGFVGASNRMRERHRGIAAALDRLLPDLERSELFRDSAL